VQNDTILYLQLISCFVISMAWAIGSVFMRDKRSPLVHWAICSVLLGMGAFLVAQRGILPDVLSYGVCNAALMVGFFGIRRGVQKFSNVEDQWKSDLHSGSLLFIGLNLVALTKFGLHDNVLSSSIFSLFSGTFLIMAGTDALRHMRRQFVLPASLSTVFPLYLAGALFIVRGVLSFYFPQDHVDNLRANSTFNSVFLTFIFTMHLMLNLSLGGLVVSKLISEIRHLSVSDALTGLANRRFLEETLELEMSRFRRWGRAFSVLMIDIDHFKTVNDTHGHDVGDEVLKRVARIMKDCARTNDITGRWGGEEFFIILTETGESGSDIFADRLRQEIENNAIVHDGHVIRLTASLGLATANSSHLNWRSMVKAADEAMYRAKSNGRNRVEKAPKIAWPVRQGSKSDNVLHLHAKRTN